MKPRATFTQAFCEYWPKCRSILEASLKFPNAKNGMRSKFHEAFVCAWVGENLRSLEEVCPFAWNPLKGIQEWAPRTPLQPNHVQSSHKFLARCANREFQPFDSQKTRFTTWNAVLEMSLQPFDQVPSVQLVHDNADKAPGS